ELRREARGGHLPREEQRVAEDRGLGLGGGGAPQLLLEDGGERALDVDAALGPEQRDGRVVAEERAARADMKRGLRRRRALLRSVRRAHEEGGAVGVARREPRERARQDARGRGALAALEALVEVVERIGAERDDVRVEARLVMERGVSLPEGAGERRHAVK